MKNNIAEREILVQTVLGRVALPDTKIQVNFRDTAFSVQTNGQGEYELKLELGQYYSFFGSKPTYLNNSTSFSSRDIKEDPNRPIRRFKSGFGAK